MTTNSLSDSIWRKLIKDFNVPICHISALNTARIVYHAQRLGLTQNTDKMVKWVGFLSKLEPAKQEAFMGLTRDVMDSMIDHVLNSEGYKEGFNKVDLQKEMPLVQMNIPTGDVFNNNNIGKCFISLDLQEAAFQAFHFWDIIKNYPNILPGGGISSYKEWVEYTIENIAHEDPIKQEMLSVDYISEQIAEYLQDSKQIRQVIFGKTNPKRIQHVEKWIVQGMVERIREDVGVLPVRLNNDEAIYEFSEELEKWVLDTFKGTDFPAHLHVTKFELRAGRLVQTAIITLDNMKFNGPLVFCLVRSEAKGGQWVDKDTKFKCLPTRFGYMFEALYKGYSKEAEYFAAQPTLAEGYVTYIQRPNVTWKLEMI